MPKTEAAEVETCACACCGVVVPFNSTYSPYDDAICAICDTEVTGRRHSQQEYDLVAAARTVQS